MIFGTAVSIPVCRGTRELSIMYHRRQVHGRPIIGILRMRLIRGNDIVCRFGGLGSDVRLGSILSVVIYPISQVIP